jgi:hypothetical protein
LAAWLTRATGAKRSDASFVLDATHQVVEGFGGAVIRLLWLIFANSEASLELLDIQVGPAVHRRTMAAIHCLLRGCEQSCFEIGDSLKVVQIVIN